MKISAFAEGACMYFDAKKARKLVPPHVIAGIRHGILLSYVQKSASVKIVDQVVKSVFRIGRESMLAFFR